MNFVTVEVTDAKDVSSVLMNDKRLVVTKFLVCDPTDQALAYSVEGGSSPASVNSTCPAVN